MRPNPGDQYTVAELNSIEWTYSDCPKVLVPIANESEEMEALSIIDVLRRAKETVTVASVEDTLEITARRKMKIVTEMLSDAAAKFQYDLIVLPGGFPGPKISRARKLLLDY